jgi:hydroxypyruvate reductase
MSANSFFTHSLHDPQLAQILAAAIEAVEPGIAVENFLRKHTLPSTRRVFVLGLGKAAIPMTKAVIRLVNVTRGLVITKHAAPIDSDSVTVIEGSHPVPDSRSLTAGHIALEFVSALSADDLLLCLISGGGSALMTAPRVPLEDLQSLTRSLLACGARIDEMNILRRHLDQVKGGGLAQATQARVVSLLLSDVVGNPLEAIASGPTAPDPTTREDALGVLEKYGLTQSIPATILRALEESPETPKANDPLFARVENIAIGSNALAAQAAITQAQAGGFQAEFLGDDWQGEARETAERLCRELALRADSTPRPFCLVAGGETTVTLRGDGKGGRNQELALAAIPLLARMKNVILVTLATDGEDGNSTAAGAVVTDVTLARAQAQGMDFAEYLACNDSNSFFGALDDLLNIGPTGTNVNDLTFLFGL